MRVYTLYEIYEALKKGTEVQPKNGDVLFFENRYYHEVLLEDYRDKYAKVIYRFKYVDFNASGLFDADTGDTNKHLMVDISVSFLRRDAEIGGNIIYTHKGYERTTQFERQNSVLYLCSEKDKVIDKYIKHIVLNGCKNVKLANDNVCETILRR